MDLNLLLFQLIIQRLFIASNFSLFKNLTFFIILLRITNFRQYLNTDTSCNCQIYSFLPSVQNLTYLIQILCQAGWKYFILINHLHKIYTLRFFSLLCNVMKVFINWNFIVLKLSYFLLKLSGFFLQFSLNLFK